MWDHRRQLGTFAVVALVLLRLAIGWHFYREGSAKLVYDKSGNRFDVPFSAEGFLSQAKGPLSDFYQSFVPDGHDWRAMLAVAKKNQPLTDEETASDAKWQIEYDARRAAATQEKQPLPAAFKPSAPYARWAKRVTDDWQTTLDKASAVPDVSDDERRAMQEALAARKQQLSDFLVLQSDAITEYQHERWRLESLRRPEADGAPFVEQQVTVATAKMDREPLAWLRQVDEIEREYVDDLRQILSANRDSDPAALTTIDDAVAAPHRGQLRALNLVVTALTITVGICLLIGLFTRLAAVAGALFLLSVIASQPPWVTGAAPTYYQIVEFAGLLVLAGTGAGRWAGLDFFGYALCSRFCGRGDAAKT